MAAHLTEIREAQNQILTLSAYQSQWNQAMERLREMRFIRRLWAKDPGLWKTDAEHQKIIRNSLGWLFVAEQVLERASELEAFAEEVKQAGFKSVVLLGMGGSSLASELFRLSLPRKKG